MNPEERRRLDRLVAALNEDDLAEIAALLPVTEADEPAELDELDDPTGQ